MNLRKWWAEKLKVGKKKLVSVPAHKELKVLLSGATEELEELRQQNATAHTFLAAFWWPRTSANLLIWPFCAAPPFIRRSRARPPGCWSNLKKRTKAGDANRFRGLHIRQPTRRQWSVLKMHTGNLNSKLWQFHFTFTPPPHDGSWSRINFLREATLLVFSRRSLETRVLPKPHVVIADLAHKRRRGSLPWASAADFDLQTERRRLKSKWSHTFENYGTAIYWFIRRYEIRLLSTIKRHFAAHLK